MFYEFKKCDQDKAEWQAKGCKIFSGEYLENIKLILNPFALLS